mgnify:CR=1 FL=1
MYTTNNPSGKNPAKARLILSGILDLALAIFFSMLIVFTLLYILCPILNITPKFLQSYNNNYDMVIATFVGGMKGLTTLILFGVAFVFMIGFMCSFPYIKSCFFLARANLSKAKEKTKTLTLNGIVQIIVGVISFGLAVFTIIKFSSLNTAKSTIIMGIIVGVLFIFNGSIKTSCAQLIKNEIVKITNPTYTKYP